MMEQSTWSTNPDYRDLPELELIHLIQSGDAHERSDALASLVMDCGPVQRMIYSLTNRFSRRGLHDAEVRLYEWLYLRVLDLPEGDLISNKWVEARNLLQDSLAENMGVGVEAQQYKRFVSAVVDGLEDQQYISKGELASIRQFDVGTAALSEAVNQIPSIQATEAEEFRIIWQVVEDTIDDEAMTIFLYKHWWNELEDLSDAMVAELINEDVGEKVTSAVTVWRRRTDAIKKIRANLGLPEEVN